MDATGFDAPEARDLLGAFLFSGDDVFKKVRSLSGGERNRLSLAEIVVSGANLLLLDEPTNNLDIPAREALEEALLEYRGTMFFISHDRYFLRKLATRVVDLEGKKLRNFLGGYDYYRSHRRLDEGPKGTKGRPRRRIRPGQNKEQSVLATRLVAVEGEIDATERRVARLEKELATSELYSDGKRSREIVTEHRKLKGPSRRAHTPIGRRYSKRQRNKARKHAAVGSLSARSGFSLRSSAFQHFSKSYRGLIMSVGPDYRW